MKIKLKKAIKHKGETIEVLDIPLEDLTGNDLIEVEKQLISEGETGVTDFNRLYVLNVAARAAHIPVEVLKFTSAGDFVRIINNVRNFLTASDSGLINEDEATIPETRPEISSEE